MDEIRERMNIQSRVCIRVADKIEMAAELLSALPQIQNVQIEDSHIAVTFGDSAAPAGIIARTLVGGDIDVIAIEPEQLKLDDAFLQLTKGIVH
jgi:hypothetical protein